MTDDVEPTTPAKPTEPTPEPSPGSTTPEPTTPAAPPAPAAHTTPVMTRPPMPDLSALDSTSRLIVLGAAVAVGVAIVGGILKTWDSTDFLLLILAGGIAAGVAAWFTSTTATSGKPAPLPLGPIELAGVAVVVALAFLRLIELIFDIDDIDGLGDITDLAAGVVLAGAAAAMGMGVLRRDPSLARFGLDRDQGTRIAAIGLMLLLAGWAINISFGYWRMSGGTLSVALATVAMIAILTAPTWVKVLPGIPMAWVGAVFGVVVAFLAIGLWGSLLGTLGEDVELGLLDYLGFVLYSVGTVGIIAGGFLAGQAAMMAGRPANAADEPAESAEPAPPVDPPADPPPPATPPAAEA